MILEYVALVIMIIVVLVMFYGIIAIHDIPYDISVKLNHPHQDVIHVACCVIMVTLHALWPFLWIWAMLYREDRGWGMDNAGADDTLGDRLEAIEARLAELETVEGE